MPSLTEWQRDRNSVSILLATYNGERFIEQSIKSILNQTFVNFELLIGFNGTTDDSKNIVNKIKDARIKVFDYGEEKGKSKTLNKLIKESRFGWIAIQDDDDLWHPNKLEKQSSFFKDYYVIVSQILYIDENDRTPTVHGYGPKLQTSDELIKKLTLQGQNQIANSSSLCKKETIESVDGWDEEVEGIEDLDLWLKMIKNNYNFINLEEILVSHRVYEQSSFNSKTWDVEGLLKKYN